MSDEPDMPLFDPPRKEQKPSGPFEHYCHCGQWGAFGFGVNARAGQDGQWFCFQHRPVEK